MAEEKPKKTKKAAAPKAAVKSGLGIKLKLEKNRQFGGERLRVTVILTQDGVEIASDSDFVTLES